MSTRRSWWRIPKAAWRAELPDARIYDEDTTNYYVCAAQADRPDLDRIGTKLPHPTAQLTADKDRYYRVEVSRKINGTIVSTVKERDVQLGDTRVTETLPGVIWLGDSVADYQ